VNLDEVRALASLDDMEMCGGEHPVRRSQRWHHCDPHKMSMGELERMTRRYTAELFEFIGPKKTFQRRT